MDTIQSRVWNGAIICARLHFAYLIGFDEEICRCGLVSKLSGDGGKEGLGSIRKEMEHGGRENDEHWCANQLGRNNQDVTKIVPKLLKM